MQFAINTTFNSVLNCTPFEAAHGLPARTISQARADAARIQFNTEEGTTTDDLVDVSKRFDDSDVKKIVELSSRFLTYANGNSEWHRRMTSNKLCQTGKRRKDSSFSVGMKVWYYRPPTQEEAKKKNRKVKHLAHYHGPAVITRRVNKHICEFKHKGKTFQREQGMLIPYESLDLSHDPEEDIRLLSPPCVHKTGMTPKEGEFVLMKGSIDYPTWYCARIREVLSDRIIVDWYTTITPSFEDFKNASKDEITSRLSSATFLRTWCRDYSKDATTIAPRTSRLLKNSYSGKIPLTELDQHLLIRNAVLTSDGHLDKATIKLASELKLPHQIGAANITDFPDKKSYHLHIFNLSKDRLAI